MPDGILLVMAFWTLTMIILITFILLMSNHLHHPTSKHKHSPSMQLKTILLGTSLIDVVSLCLVGMSLLSTWYIGKNTDTAIYCAHLSWRAVPTFVSVLFIVVILVWMRQSFLLKDVKVPMRIFILEPSQLLNTGYLSVIVSGPTIRFIAIVLLALFLAMTMDYNDQDELDVDDFSLCIREPVPPNYILTAGVVFVHVLWWSLAVLTAKIIQQRQDYSDGTLFSISLVMDNHRVLLSSEVAQGVCQRGTSSKLSLFLAMTSIWLPAVQSLLMIDNFDFSETIEAKVLFLTWVYCCTAAFLSLLLSVSISFGLRGSKSDTGDDAVGHLLPKCLSFSLSSKDHVLLCCDKYRV